MCQTSTWTICISRKFVMLLTHVVKKWSSPNLNFWIFFYKIGKLLYETNAALLSNQTWPRIQFNPNPSSVRLPSPSLHPLALSRPNQECYLKAGYKHDRASNIHTKLTSHLDNGPKQRRLHRKVQAKSYSVGLFCEMHSLWLWLIKRKAIR